ncbi:MAG: hypothetical protein FD156_33 [Nitrospirae bacterium]|nr:MAG: hypothetical protein FD156_33 [Nitrospirota bacterium]
MIENNGIKNIFTFVAYWVVVPLILVGLFFLGRSIMLNVPMGENRTSARSGFWAGLVLFVIYFVYEIALFKTPEFVKIETLQLNIWGVISGLFLGFAMLFGIKYLIPTRIVGFLILFLTFSSASALYSYVFIQTFNEWLLSSTLGVAFGALLHIMIWPKSIHDIFVKLES